MGLCLEGSTAIRAAMLDTEMEQAAKHGIDKLKTRSQTDTEQNIFVHIRTYITDRTFSCFRPSFTHILNPRQNYLSKMTVCFERGK